MIMPNFSPLDKTEFYRVKLKSVHERQRLAKLLQNTKALDKKELLADLAQSINSTSFKEVLRKTYFTDPSLPGRNFANTFSEGFKSEPLPNLPVTSYLQMAVENLNIEAGKVAHIFDYLGEYRRRITKRDEHALLPIKMLVEECGFSKIALMKLFQLEVFSHDTSESDKKTRGEIYKTGRVRHLGDTLMVIDQSIQPRGRPFRTMLAYSKQIDFGEGYYAKYREELSDCFCPFPISETQVGGFCQLLSGFSIADQLVGTIGLHNIAKLRGWEVAGQVESFAGPELRDLMEKKSNTEDERRFFEVVLPSESTDYDIYNASIANRDYLEVSSFRNRADALLLPKFSTAMTPHSSQPSRKHLKEIRRVELRSGDLHSSSVSCRICAENQLKLSPLLRFLDFRNNWPTDFSIDANAIGLVIESGMPLHRMLADQEIEKLALSARHNNDHLGVLMLRYFPVIREYSEDADYLFLRALENAVSANHLNDLVGFIESLSSSNPVFATGLILALSPRRLQKCYDCISGYKNMTSTHRKLLEIAARITGDLDLVIQADQIALDEKLASVRAHFDSSRIFVDEVLFKNWALEAVSPSLLALRKHVYLYSPDLPDNPTPDEIAASMKTGALQKIVEILRQHFVDLPIQDAFKRFCLDHYFGVDSFLGRRIRHNATHGVLLGQLEKLCLAAIDKDPQDQLEIRHAFDSWKKEYLQEVNGLVNEKFRFKTAEFPNGLLAPSFEDLSEKMTTIESDLISQTIVNSKPEVVIQNMITGFWGALEPELKKMRRFLKSEFTQSTLESVDRHFNNLSSPTMAFSTDLRVTLMERIERLASWYSPFSPADISISPADLAQMVWNDTEDSPSPRKLIIEGDAGDVLVKGGNVRTLYDCLHVILVNAMKHSSGHDKVKLKFISQGTELIGVKELSVSITSSLSQADKDLDKNSKKYSKMSKEIASNEMSEKAMVIQGYSGLRKLRYLLFRTRRSETLDLDWANGEVTLKFEIPLNFLGAPVNDCSD